MKGQGGAPHEPHALHQSTHFPETCVCGACGAPQAKKQVERGAKALEEAINAGLVQRKGSGKLRKSLVPGSKPRKGGSASRSCPSCNDSGSEGVGLPRNCLLLNPFFRSINSPALAGVRLGRRLSGGRCHGCAGKGDGGAGGGLNEKLGGHFKDGVLHVGKVAKVDKKRAAKRQQAALKGGKF